MTQKAEVKVVVNTAEAEAALRRLEAEAAKIEAEVSTTGKKARAGGARASYKNAKGGSLEGQTQHQSAAPQTATTTAATAAAGAVIANRLEKAKQTAKGNIRTFLTADPQAEGFHKGQYRTSYASYLSHGLKTNPNLVAVLSQVHTDFFVMEGLDRSRLMAASMGVGKSRLYNLYGWWLGKEPKQKWMNNYKNDVADQVRANYDAMEGSKMPNNPSTPVKRGKMTWGGRFKKIGQAMISNGLGVAGRRAVLSTIGVGVAGMLIKQLGAGARKRVDVIRKGGVLGWVGHVLGTIGKGVYEFGEDVGYEGWKIIGEIGTLGASALNETIGGFEGYVKDGQRLVKRIDEMHDNIKKERPGVDPYNPFITQAAREVGDHLTEKGRFGTPNENRAWALRLMNEALKRAEKKSGLGNQG